MAIFALSTLMCVLFSLNVKPFNTKSLNFIDCFNEISLLAISIFLMTFTSFIDNGDLRFMIGWYYIGFVVFIVVVNLILTTVTNIKETIVLLKSIYLQVKLKYFMLKFRKA